MYSYTKIDRFNDPNNYMYTPFYGADFLNEYLENRNNAISFLELQLNNEVQLKTEKIFFCQTYNKLNYIMNLVDKGDHKSYIPELELFIRRFEVAKKLRSEYPVIDQNDIAPLKVHLLFFHLLIKSYQANKDIRYINVLVKLSDSLISVKKNFKDKKDVALLAFLLNEELKIVRFIMTEMDVRI